MKLLNALKKVLVVEDDPSICKALVERFEREGYRVVACTDGKDVLATIVSEKPDGILLDLMLPNKDGMTILETLRSPETGMNVPVVILTNLMGRARLRDDAAALNAKYFDKSTTKIEEVVAVLAQML